MYYSIIKKSLRCCLIITLSSSFFCAQRNNSTPIPISSRQMIVVITESVEATKGTLYRFERNAPKTNWRLLSEKAPVVLGRNGLGWGRGLHKLPIISDFPIKEEGDGRSPAGVFTLSSVFGYASATEMASLKMPYIPLNEMTECVDDTASSYYNAIVEKDKIKSEAPVDWQSSEKMRFAGIYYELGVVIDHNRDPVKEIAGSCIFLHNWSTPDETMAGCTAMTPEKMKEIVTWLDAARNPIFIQLTKQLYIDCAQVWELPELIE